MAMHRSTRPAQGLRHDRRAGRHRSARRRGPHRRPDRPERRRQDHRAQRDPRPHPLRGRADVLGRDPWTERDQLMRDVCFIADVAVLPRWMRVSQALDYVAGVHPRFDRAKAEAFLAKHRPSSATARCGELSKGMVAQLHLALVMAIDARLLVLDEPTLGLDILLSQAVLRLAAQRLLRSQPHHHRDHAPGRGDPARPHRRDVHRPRPDRARAAAWRTSSRATPK